jgi:Ca2+-binding RTX toxin-like protein
MTTYYVSVRGDNAGNGSAGAPWRTISKAMWTLQAGDELVVGSGTYNEFVRISPSGTANAPIVVRSAEPGGAKIVPPKTADFGVHVQGDYVTLDGFEISGAKTSGITANLVHHVTISNNVSHDNGHHGISASRSDFVKIVGNVTYDNASDGFYSGISVFHPENITGNMSHKGFRIIVRDNISFNNVTKTGPHSDGNGIIMDDFRSTKTAGRDPYLFPSLVENNLVYGNGGKGIQVDWTDYATVRNNTAWHNNVDPLSTGTWHAELSNMNSSHNTWVNNIAVADSSTSGENRAIDNTSFVGYVNSNNVWKSNLTFSGTAGDASIRNAGGNATLTLQDGNLLGVDPLIHPSRNFRLHPDSPAIDMGTRAHGNVAHDLYGKLRTGLLDIGAHEAGESSLAGNNYLIGGAGANAMHGYEGNDTLMGLSGGDSLRGGMGNDSLNGGGGADFLDGGKGKDLLEGGAGRDIMIGNIGSDRFAFRATTESGRGAAADQIRDFSRGQGDKIDLSDIDANTKAYGDQAFNFIDDAAFSKQAAELRYEHGVLSGDVNGDRVADFQIVITNHADLAAGDFLL